MQGFLTRDGIRSAELLRLGYEQPRPYDSVEVQRLKINSIAREGRVFRAMDLGTSDGAPVSVTAWHVLLATGVANVLPPLPGFRELRGQGVLHCPYCHG